MNRRPAGRRPRATQLLAPAVVVVALVLASCSGGGATNGRATSGATGAATGDVHTGARPSAQSGSAALPSPHVHGIARDPRSGKVALATHDGLFMLAKNGTWQRVGPVIDLMGFAVMAPGSFYASGHPGMGTNLPQPAGLLKSLDGGRSWTTMSRGGESDFHALAASSKGFVGFDGTTRSSPDGNAWTEGILPTPPRMLAAAPDGSRILATLEKGVFSSTDGGRTWSALPGAPLLLLAAWADPSTVVGATPQGAVTISTDAGRSWRTTSARVSTPQALAAGRNRAGTLEILAVTNTAVLSSADNGTSFTAVLP